MRQATGMLDVQTRGRGLIEVTREVEAWVGETGMREGLLTVFCRHTSASVIIQENAAPEVRADLEAFFEQLPRKTPRAIATTTKGRTTCPRTSAPR